CGDDGVDDDGVMVMMKVVERSMRGVDRDVVWQRRWMAGILPESGQKKVTASENG
ncbi:hypothetical protein Tco_0592241, partial [Tanacetum coccineum]